MFSDYRLRRLRLRLPFAVLALFIALVVAVGAAVLVWQARQSALAEAGAVNRGMARALSRHVFHVIRSSEVLLDQMLAETQRQGGVEALRADDRAMHAMLQQLVRPLTEVNTGLVVDGAGNLLASNHMQPVAALNYADRAWFQAHQGGKDLVIGEPVVGRTSGAAIITISRAWRDAGGHLVAAALVGVEVRYLERLFADGHADDGRAATLFLEDGTLIARNPVGTPGRRYPDAPVLQQARTQPSGIMPLARSAVDGSERYTVWDRVGDYPLVVVVGQTADSVLAPWQAFAGQVTVLVAAMLAALVYAGRFVLASIRREEAALTAAEDTAHDLARANESLSSVLAAAPEGIVGTDAGGRVVFVNDAALRLTGFERSDLVGQRLHDRVQHHHADGSPYPAAASAMRQGVLTGELYIGADEVFWRRDGTSFPVEYSAGRLDLPRGGFGTVVVFRDITARRRMEEELKRSNADLEQFAYAVSHDLQEPLRTISGFVGLLKRGYRQHLPDEAVEFIDSAVDGVKRMTGMIDDLLAYSRIGRTDIVPVAVALDQCAARARDSLLAAIDEAGATVELAPLPVVPAIEGQMVSLFQNLLGNAIKYGDRDRRPHIAVAARREGRDWVIRVADNGIGIAPRDRDRVFQVFQRLHRRGISGSGVGLALCRRVVERHHGDIWIEDREDGFPGAVFAIRLPAI
jgi:PAS domain S-box-containing protein